jgi:ribonuclease Z
MKRFLRGGLAFVLVTAAVLYIFRIPITERLMRRQLANNLRVSLIDELPDGLHVALCGAGSPLPDPERSGPCTAVIAGKQLFIVDAGAGSSRILARSRIPQGKIEAVLLTHFHSDHIDGLGELLLQRWVGGTHTTPARVYGPVGVDEVVAGFQRAYILDSAYRVAHHGEQVVPRSGAGGTPVTIPLLAADESRVVLEKDGLVITAFSVDHAPVSPAFGYRFDYGGRSVVISGDTSKSANLQRVASGVDLLVHEALSPELVGVLHDAAEDAGVANVAKIASDIVGYHTTPVEAAEIARDARVRHLVFNHIVPPLPLRPLRDAFLRGVGEVYDGPVTLGHDGSFFSLPAGSEAIEQRDLLTTLP